MSQIEIYPDPAKRRTVDDLPPEWRERYEERAGIMEFDGGLPRFWAEAQALLDIIQCMDRESSAAPDSSPTSLAFAPHRASRFVVDAPNDQSASGRA